MARRKMSVEGMLVGHFVAVDLGEGYRLLDIIKGILAARVAMPAAPVPAFVPHTIKSKRPRKVKAVSPDVAP